MKLTSKGQVTIPADLRHRHEFEKGDEADIVDDGTIRRIVHVKPGQSRAEVRKWSTGCAAGGRRLTAPTS